MKQYGLGKGELYVNGKKVGDIKQACITAEPRVTPKGGTHHNMQKQRGTSLGKGGTDRCGKF